MTDQIDAWIEQARGGMTNERLNEVFDLVKPPGNWKDPIRAHVHVEAASREEIETAVTWFTGSVPTIVAQGGTAWWYVEANGYYADVGA